MNKDLKKILEALTDQGFEVRVTRKQHYEIRLDGHKVATFSGSASDSRSVKNSIADCRRAGFRWPR